MDRKTYRKLFISRRAEQMKMNEKGEKDLANFWDRVEAFELEYGKSIDDGYTKGDFVQLFSSLNGRNIASYRTDRSRVQRYVENLIEDDILDSSFLSEIVSVKYEDLDSEHLLSQRFFKDFDALHNSINATQIAADKPDPNVYATQIAAIYMAWCGVKLEEALMIKKDDVGEDTIRVGERVIAPNKTIMDFIKEYRDEVGYVSRGRTDIYLKYMPSVWLFRTTRSDHVDSPKTMRIFIRNFSKNIDSVDNSVDTRSYFNYDKVYRSGVYHRVYLYECVNGKIQKGDIETIREVFGEPGLSPLQADDRLRNYRMFAKYFFNA